MPELEPLRFVKVAEAREQLKEANSLIRRLSNLAGLRVEVFLREDIDDWLRKLPSVMEGLPQSFDLDDQVCYRATDGSIVDGVIVATVTCHEQYVVAPGDSRATKGEPMYMVHAHRIVKRGEIPPVTIEEKPEKRNA